VAQEPIAIAGDYFFVWTDDRRDILVVQQTTLSGPRYHQSVSGDYRTLRSEYTNDFPGLQT
jgi:hypothetical protein